MPSANAASQQVVALVSLRQLTVLLDHRRSVIKVERFSFDLAGVRGSAGEVERRLVNDSNVWSDGW